MKTNAKRLKNEAKNMIDNPWKLLGAIFIFALIIWGLSFCHGYNLDMKNSVIATFIGVLATFIVVGQYAQVINVKNEFANQVAEVQKKASDDISKKIEELKTNLVNEIETRNLELWYGIYAHMVFDKLSTQIELEDKDKWFIINYGIHAMNYAWQANRISDLEYMVNLIKDLDISNGFVSKEGINECLTILRKINIDNNDNINAIFKKISEMFVKGYSSNELGKSLIGEWKLTNPTEFSRVFSLKFMEDGSYNWGGNSEKDFWCLDENNVLKMWAGQVQVIFKISFSEDKNTLTLTNTTNIRDKRIYERTGN
jgi:hypothetical protein